MKQTAPLASKHKYTKKKFFYIVLCLLVLEIVNFDTLSSVASISRNPRTTATHNFLDPQITNPKPTSH